MKAKLFYDPTESRSGTRLPQTLVNLGLPLPGLERLTKADLLITLSNQTLPPLKLKPLYETKLPDWLKNACLEGMLIQRKTGLDFFSSIPHLTETIATMFSWCNASWLSVIGDVTYNDMEQACISDHGQLKTTDWMKHHVKGMVRKWQLSGGMYSDFSNDTEFISWVKGLMDGELDKILNEEKIVKIANRNVTIPDENIFTSLSLTPKGLGYSSIQALIESLNNAGVKDPTPLMVLQLATSKKLQDRLKVKGWGVKSIEKMCQWWSVDEGVEIDVMSESSNYYLHQIEWLESQLSKEQVEDMEMPF